MAISRIPSDGIVIENFIFHVVHHGESEPILMDETPITGYEVFFKRRIQEILHGNSFVFEHESKFLKQIKSIEFEKKDFVEISKEIAIDLHPHKDNRIKAGVMILMKVKINNNTKYILIKYDHEDVIYYRLENKKAILSEISNTFSKSKDALQKSAIIDLSKEEITAIIVDKSERENITKFFKNFLGVKRILNDTALTVKVKECYKETVKEFKDLLPKEYTRQSDLHFYNTIQNNQKFTPDLFLSTIFGEYYNVDIEKSFQKKLRSKDIHGEEFNYDINHPKPKLKKYSTAEGVQINYPNDAEDTVVIKDLKDKTVITITTQKLTEE